MTIRRFSASSINSGVEYNAFSAGVTPIPSVPTISAVTSNTQTSATLTITPGTYAGTTYTAVSTPGNISASSTSTTITVNGVTSGTSYTFTVTASNSTGTSAASAPSTSVTILSLPTVSGGILTSDSTYYYRTFTSNSSLTVTNGPVTADVLVVGGGGSGTQAGGGGGGIFYATNQSLASSSWTVTVGSGGPYNTTQVPSTSYAGQDSIFGTLTRGKGGGNGGANNGINVQANLIGGCGGGGCGSDAQASQPGGQTIRLELVAQDTELIIAVVSEHVALVEVAHLQQEQEVLRVLPIMEVTEQMGLPHSLLGSMLLKLEWMQHSNLL